MKKYIILHLCFFFAAAASYCNASCQLPSKRYTVAYKDKTLPLPYDSSHDLFTPNPSIRRVLFFIHSSSYNPNDYFATGKKMAANAPQGKEQTLFITPLFTDTKHLPDDADADFLYWKGRAFWGSSKATFNKHDIQISAFDVIDIMLKNLIASKNFPKLEEIVILGHSAGGQMVNRYAACNIFEARTATPNNIDVKYVVTAPSSYVYLSKERPVESSPAGFSIPENAPSKYNKWGYGLEHLYSYHKRNKVTAEWMFQQYPAKKVLYLVGSKDNNPEHKSLDRSPSAMLQGAHRLIRGNLYYNYLKHTYNEQLVDQQFKVVQNVGHYGPHLMASPECLKFVFEN